MAHLLAPYDMIHIRNVKKSLTYSVRIEAVARRLDIVLLAQLLELLDCRLVAAGLVAALQSDRLGVTGALRASQSV